MPTTGRIFFAPLDDGTLAKAKVPHYSPDGPTTVYHEPYRVAADFRELEISCVCHILLV